MSPKKLLWVLPVLLTACGRGNNTSEHNSNPAATSANSSISDTVAEKSLALNSPERKVIRTADLRCKVQNVYTATTKLEQMVKATGGIVQESHIFNDATATKTAWYTQDSVRELQTYTCNATLTLRIPTQYLDSVINAIPGMVSFIDNRTVKQSDVTYQYLNNELKNLAVNMHIIAPIKGKQQLAARQYEDSKEEQQIDRKVENLLLMDNVSYATLTVALSQPEQVFAQTIVNVAHATRTPLILQCKAALYNGWEMTMSFIIVLVNIWPLLILLALWIVYRKRWSRLLVIRK
ncbi:MAG: hypothetical protein JWQ38_2061 [Flavipsychrobacter sp.]|nr:hypothetical protein [Flavipsychrobacter sp.]